MTPADPQPIADALHRAWKKRSAAFFWTGVVSYTGLLLLLVSIFGFLEHTFYLASGLKWLYAAGSAGTLVFLLIRFLRHPAMDERTFVKRAGAETGIDDLIRFYDLHRAMAGPFDQLAVDQIGRDLENRQAAAALARAPLMQRTRARLRLSAGFALVSAALAAATAVLHPEAYLRAFTLWETYFPPNPYIFSVEPGDRTLEAGAPFDARIRFRGRQPRRTWLEIKTAGESSWRRMPLLKENDTTLAAAGLLLNELFEYRFRMDEYASGRYEVRVERLPRWEHLQVLVIPPAYTGQPPTSASYPVSQFEALPGSTIRIRGGANKPLDKAALAAFHHRPSVAVLGPDSLEFRFTLVKSDTLAFALADSLGLTNNNPFTLTFVKIDDQAPALAILSPQPELELPAPDTVAIQFAAQDDYGLRYVRLHLRVKHEITGKTDSLSADMPPGLTRQLNSGTYHLDLRALGMEALDQATYWMETSDNDAVSGFKRVETPRHTIRIAGLTDLLMDLEERNETVEEGLQDASESFESVEQEFKELKESLKKQDRQNWDQQQSISRMEENLEKVQEKLKETASEFEKLREELQKNDVISDETKKQFEELQRLMEEIDDPALLKLMEEMQKGLQNIDQNQLRQALEKFQFDEERYRERLERTMDLFKSLQTMAELDKLDRRLKDMEERESKLEESKAGAEQFDRTQEALQKELEPFKDAAGKLPEKAPGKQKEQTEKLSRELQQDAGELDRQLQESREQNRKGGQKPKTGEIREKMKQMRKKIAETREGMSRKQVQLNIAALRASLIDLIFLSELEEQVVTDVNALEFRSEGFADQARRQNVLQQQFKRISDTLSAVSREVPQLSNRILEKRSQVQERLQVSLQHLAERDRNNAASDIRFAMGGINELASMIADIINQLEDQQSGEGGEGGMSSEQLMESLKQMSGQQQKLNQQIQDLINDVQGNRLTQSQSERLDQMARQQNEIRKKLREIQKNAGLSPGDKVLSELERLAQQMEDSINEMRGGNTDRTMVFRQQNILTRMLEVEKALDQREEDEKRKGDRPKDLPPAVRPQMTLEELRKKIQERLSDPSQTRYSPEFEELVRLYFELIGS